MSDLENIKLSELSRYEAVNACESLGELAEVIEAMANKDGYILGRRQAFGAKVMANYCRAFNLETTCHLTRCWGIRQQAMYISHKR
jgi:hypothetical protein